MTLTYLITVLFSWPAGLMLENCFLNSALAPYRLPKISYVTAVRYSQTRKSEYFCTHQGND